MIDAKKIVPKCAVVGSDNAQFAVVDRVEKNSIRLSTDTKGAHHYIPMSWVKSVDDNKVHLDRPRAQAMREWTDTPSPNTQPDTSRRP